MKKIELGPYEEKDLLDVLEFALQEYTYREQFDKTGMSRYWIRRIKQLKKVVKGEYVSLSGSIASTMRTFEE